MDLQHHQTQWERLEKAKEEARSLLEKVEKLKKEIIELEQRKTTVQGQIDELTTQKERLEKAIEEREQKSFAHNERMMKGFDELIGFLEKGLNN